MASKRRIRRRSCEGKISHKTRGEAFLAIRALIKENGVGGKTVGLHPYPCKFCKGYHVGHKKQWKGAA